MADDVSTTAISDPNYESIETPHAVELQNIERELVALRLATPCAVVSDVDASADAQPMTRACMSNLIIYCDTPAEADALSPHLGLLAHSHPARIILLVAKDPDQSQDLVARVSAGLTRPGKRRQVSSEQIRISASSTGRGRLASAVRGLLVGDLPTALWWNSNRPPPATDDVFRDLEHMSESVLYDSRGWSKPSPALVSTANWVLGGKSQRQVTDLAWMRTKFWRHLFAETLAPRLVPGALGRIDEVAIEHGPHALPMVLLFVAWLARCLDWETTGSVTSSAEQLTLNFRSPAGAVRVSVKRQKIGPAEFRRITLRAAGDAVAMQAFEADYEVLDSGLISIVIDSGTRSENFVSVPKDPVIKLLAWQLANRTGQTEFRDVMVLAKKMAGAITH